MGERELERGWRGAWEDRGGYQEVLLLLFCIASQVLMMTSNSLCREAVEYMFW